MSKTMIVATDKYGTFIYGSAVALLSERVIDGCWYLDAQEQAEDALEEGEEAAWKFLKSRKDYEYEYVEKQVVNT